MTLAAWHARYMQIRRHDIGPATRALHARTFDLLMEAFGDVPLASIGKRQAQEFRLYLVDRRYVDSTICKHVRTAKTLWKTAIDWEYAASCPWQGVRSTAPIKDVTDRQPLSVDEGEALIAAAGARWRAVVAVLFYAGLRRGEATRLRWDDIDFESGRIVVRNPEGRQTSKKRSRTVRLEPRLADILSRCDQSHPLVVGAGCSERSGLSHIVRTIGQRAGIPGVTPQILRQARSTIWFSDFPSHVAAAWMGHSAEVARRHYLGVPDAFYVPAPAGGEGTSFTQHGPERTVSGPAHAIGATRWLPRGSG